MKAPDEFEGVYIHRDPVDMRNAINGLSSLVAAHSMGDLMGPHLFVFCGKRRKTIKVLYFDKSGFALWQKRLEKDLFPWPKKHVNNVVKLTPAQFKWLLDGYDVWKVKPFEKLHFDAVF